MSHPSGRLLTDVPADQKDRVKVELGELEKLVTVTKVVIGSHDEPPRYLFTFPTGGEMWKHRLELEKAGFDVGANPVKDGARLGFYATRRLTKGDGWEV